MTSCPVPAVELDTPSAQQQRGNATQIGEPFNPWRGACGFYPPEIIDRLKTIVDTTGHERTVLQGQKRVFEKLVRRAGRSGRCWPSVGTLAESLARSERSIIRDIKALTEFGLIERERRGSANGRRRLTNRYQFIAHQVFVGHGIFNTTKVTGVANPSPHLSDICDDLSDKHGATKVTNAAKPNCQVEPQPKESSPLNVGRIALNQVHLNQVLEKSHSSSSSEPYIYTASASETTTNPFSHSPEGKKQPHEAAKSPVSTGHSAQAWWHAPGALTRTAKSFRADCQNYVDDREGNPLPTTPITRGIVSLFSTRHQLGEHLGSRIPLTNLKAAYADGPAWDLQLARRNEPAGMEIANGIATNVPWWKTPEGHQRAVNGLRRIPPRDQQSVLGFQGKSWNPNGRYRDVLLRNFTDPVDFERWVADIEDQKIYLRAKGPGLYLTEANHWPERRVELNALADELVARQRDEIDAITRDMVERKPSPPTLSEIISETHRKCISKSWQQISSVQCPNCAGFGKNPDTEELCQCHGGRELNRKIRYCEKCSDSGLVALMPSGATEWAWCSCEHAERLREKDPGYVDKNNAKLRKLLTGFMSAAANVA